MVHPARTTCHRALPAANRSPPQKRPYSSYPYALAFAYDNLDLVTADLVREREALARESVEPPAVEPVPQNAKARAAAAQAAQAHLPFKK